MKRRKFFSGFSFNNFCRIEPWDEAENYCHLNHSNMFVKVNIRVNRFEQIFGTIFEHREL